MISNKQIDEGFDEFIQLSKTINNYAAYVVSVRSLEKYFDKPEEPKSPLPDIENNIPMPKVNEPKKEKTPTTRAYIEADGIKYYPESEEPKCKHEKVEHRVHDYSQNITTIGHRPFCPKCGDKL